MSIVDSHHHLGQGCVFDGWTATEQEITAAQDRHDVVASVIQPWPGATPDPKKVHDAIAAFARSRPGRIFGMANVNPHYDQPGAAAEIRRCVKDLGFKAVKCHTIGHALNPNGKDAQVIFEPSPTERVLAPTTRGDYAIAIARLRRPHHNWQRDRDFRPARANEPARRAVS